MKSIIKHYFKINFLLLFILAPLSCSIRLEIKTDSEFLSTIKKSNSEIEIKIKQEVEEENPNPSTITNKILASNSSDSSIKPNNQILTHIKNNDKNVNSNANNVSDFIAESLTAKNSTNIKSNKNNTKSNLILDRDANEEVIYLRNKNQEKNKTESKNYNSKNITSHYHPDQIYDDDNNPKKHSKNNKSTNHSNPDKIDDDINTNPKINKTNSNNNTFDYFDPNKNHDSAAKGSNTITTESIPLNPKNISTLQSKPKNNSYTSLIYETDSTSIGKRSRKNNLKHEKKPKSNNKTLDSDKIKEVKIPEMNYANRNKNSNLMTKAKHNSTSNPKDNLKYYYLPKIGGASDQSTYPCADCRSVSSSPNELVLSEKPGIKFDSVTYVRQLSAGAKAALELEEVDE